MAVDAAARLRRHLLDAAIGSVGDVLFGFRLRPSVPVGQSPSGCSKQRRFPRDRSGRANRHRFFSQAFEADRCPGQCRRRLILCAWFLCPMGYLPPLSLRRIVRSVRSALRGRCRVLSLSSALLRAIAEQLDVANGVRARDCRSDVRVLWITAAGRQWKDRSGRQCHFTSVRASFYSGWQLGIWALPRSLQPRLLHSGHRLWSRLYGGSCDEDRPVDHGRRLGRGMCAARAQFFPPALQSAPRGVGHLCGPLCRRNPAAPRCLSKVLCTTERAGAGDPLSEELHRLHAQGLSARGHPGNFLSGPGGPDARGGRKERRHDPEHSSVGLAAAASDISTDPGNTPLLSVL